MGKVERRLTGYVHGLKGRFLLEGVEKRAVGGYEK